MTLSDDDRTKKFESTDKDSDLDYNIKTKLLSFKTNTELWDFVKHHSEILFGINDFTPYRRATESTKDIPRSITKQAGPLAEVPGLLAEAATIIKELGEIDITPELKEPLNFLAQSLMDISSAFELLRPMEIEHETENLSVRIARTTNLRHSRPGILEKSRRSLYDIKVKLEQYDLDLRTLRWRKDIVENQRPYLEKLIAIADKQKRASVCIRRFQRYLDLRRKFYIQTAILTELLIYDS